MQPIIDKLRGNLVRMCGPLVSDSIRPYVIEAYAYLRKRGDDLDESCEGAEEVRRYIATRLLPDYADTVAPSMTDLMQIASTLGVDGFAIMANFVGGNEMNGWSIPLCAPYMAHCLHKMFKMEQPLVEVFRTCLTRCYGEATVSALDADIDAYMEAALTWVAKGVYRPVVHIAHWYPLVARAVQRSLFGSAYTPATLWNGRMNDAAKNLYDACKSGNMIAIYAAYYNFHVREIGIHDHRLLAETEETILKILRQL